ncbi:solute carrier family 22 member [Trifolium pratense]|uniref:Solute carrier family 22 member n=1 Tax=Trifolium pratense TaxID=57577 RepID=A0A2K3PCH0_TRIPR|nr:solute carrier family 22 member [Trifolium pratense]
MLKRVSSEENADDDNGELFHKRWAIIRMIAVMILGIGIGMVYFGRKNNIFSYGVFGAVIILSNFTLFCLPETKGIVLCDTMDQQEKKEIALRDAINQEKTGIVSV